MRKLYYLACSIVLSGLTACEVPPLADGSSAETAEGVATAPISHTIPAAKALEHLAGALVALDGPTRSPGESRTVQRVTAVTRDDLRASATRSGECSADSLVYLVEFEDGKGSAILAADDRLEPVIVIYDTYKICGNRRSIRMLGGHLKIFIAKRMTTIIWGQANSRSYLSKIRFWNINSSTIISIRK
mgnify:FL=1